jgi:hypothetical protein
MNSQPNTNINVLPVIKTPKEFYITSFIILLMVIISITTLYNVNGKQDEISSDITITIIMLVIFFGLIALIPSIGSIVSLLSQIKWATMILVYTIFLIIFFRMTSVETLKQYANVIMPVVLLIGAFLFYKGFTTNYASFYNVSYERIKTVIMFFCFITILILFYNIDVGNYLHKYLGPSFILILILAIFAFLYVIVLLTLPDNKNGMNATSFLSNFSKFSVYNALMFFVFLIVITILLLTYPGGFFNQSSKLQLTVLFTVFIIVILWSIIITANVFSGSNNQPNANFDFYKKALLLLFGIVISILLIYWLVNAIPNLSSTSSIISFILNILIVVIVMTLVYRTMNVKMPDNSFNAKKNAFFDMIINFIYYIPCLFSNTIDSTLINGKQGPSYFSSEKNSFIMLFVVIVLILLYAYGSDIYNKIILQGGELLVNKPVNTNKEYSLGTYEELNNSENFDYQYALSSWVYINSDAPNTNDSYSKYTTLLNFGGKPNVLYNASTNSLMITMDQKDLKQKTTNKLMEFDEDGNRILYVKHNVLLQKWNNIIINYSGGILDVFLNGELVKSDIGVVPYYTLDSLTIGKDGGVNGGICNVVYFKNALKALNVYILYNMIKNKDPPTTNESNITIMKSNLQTLSNSDKEL